MQIKEYFTKGKISNDTNEDGLYISKDIIAVIDGVTSKTSNLYDGHKSGYVAKKIVLDTLKHIDPRSTFEETLLHINNNLFKYHKEIGKEKEYFSAQIIMYNNYYKEIWNFGDSSCMINGHVHLHDKLYDEITSNARALYDNLLLKQGYTVEQLLEKDLGAEYIEPLLKNQYLYDNNIDSPYGYPVLNGQEIHFNHLIKYEVKKGDEVVLASDGYPLIKPTLKESERYLNDILKKDPLCINKFVTTKGLKKGYKSYDDRTYVRFIV